MKIVRTHFENKDFADLVAELDKELAITDGDDHAFYDQFNSIDNINYAIVLYDNATPIGCGALKPLDDLAMEVKRVFVIESHRGKQLAGKMMEELESWASELKFTHCRLETGINQHEAIRLYHKCKYTIIENYGQYAGLDTSICFEKKLS